MDRFLFAGFVPQKQGERKHLFAEFERLKATLIFFESPHRIVETLQDLGLALPGRQIAVTRELTKLHEETWRGTLADASTHLAENAPRGEYVLVLEGAPDIAVDATDDTITEALRLALAGGADRRTAIATVTTSTGANKRRVYDLALTIPR